MKKALVILCAVLLTALFAGTVSATVPAGFDPFVISQVVPAVILDPCSGATFVADMVNLEELFLDAGMNVELATYELQKDSVTVGHGFSKYAVHTFGTDTYVASEETIIVDAKSFTAYGQSSNTTSGIAGARGIITGAVSFSGDKISAIQGTYAFSDFTGSLRFCAFITP